MRGNVLDKRLSDCSRVILVFIAPFSFLQKYLSVTFGLPTAFSYITDFLLLLSFAFYCLDHNSLNASAANCNNQVVRTMGMFVVFALFTALVHLVSPFTFLWAIRNTCRFFLYFYLVCKLLSKKDIENIFHFLNVFVTINTLIIIYQYFAIGLRMDYLNGLVGSYAGGNAVLNMVMCALTIWHVSRYVAGLTAFRSLVIPILSMLITSALNETKIYFFELLLIGLICALVTTDSKTCLKALFFIFILMFASYIGLQFFLVLYPGFKGFLSPEFLQDYLFERSYNSSELLFWNGVPIMNRFSSFSIISESFLDGAFELLSGLGFGACEHSSFPLFDTAFYRLYGETNYMGYSTAYIFLETGAIGLVLYLSIFFSAAVSAFKLKETASQFGLGKLIPAFGVAASAILIITCFYNSSLRIETSGYLAFLLLAVPFILLKSEKVYGDF